uniref:Uncharacterized protein n=1 Tax=Setaria viridis TaxID=4556 RepID=A0A4U6WIW6_SETVI|nr:hypothetical protein SEVIR_1G344050v2 [Setaria viridis]
MVSKPGLCLRRPHRAAGRRSPAPRRRLSPAPSCRGTLLVPSRRTPPALRYPCPVPSRTGCRTSRLPPASAP